MPKPRKPNTDAVDALARTVADIQWQNLRNSHHRGTFDLATISPEAVPHVFAIFRKHLPLALLPLRPFLPLSLSLRNTADKRDPLLGINVGNTLEIKPKAEFAAALLDGMLRLKNAPPLSPTDRQLYKDFLAATRTILARCNDMEPRATAIHQEEEKDRLAKEKARAKNKIQSPATARRRPTHKPKRRPRKK